MAATDEAVFPIKLNGKPTNLYDVLRCGMVHEYAGKGLAAVDSNPDDPDGTLSAGAN